MRVRSLRLRLIWCLVREPTSLCFSSVQPLSRVWLCDPTDSSTPGFPELATNCPPVHHQLLSTTNCQSLLKLTSIESVMPSNHLIPCHPLLLLPSTIFLCPIFLPLILFMGFSRQEYWSGLPFSSPVGHVLSELFTMTCPPRVASHRMARSSIGSDKAVIHVISLASPCA